MDIAHGNQSIYIPKNSRTFIRICMQYSKEELEEPNFSPFALMCMKEFINNLSPMQKAKFEAIAERMAQKEQPRSTAFVKQFMEGTENGD